MTYSLFVTEILVAFILAACLLYRYGDCYRNHIVVTLAVFTAWYFSFIIMFILPLDVSSTVLRTCRQNNNETTAHAIASIQQAILRGNGSISSTPLPPVTPICLEPWSKVPDYVFPNLWRVVYWTSQCLTWLIMPMMQSYSKSGDFTIKGKLKSALIDNAIYYGSYLFICGILLIYLALQPDVHLDGPKIKAIASSASNTWGLFLLVLLLGYALVEVPRSLWNNSIRGYTLTHSYFKAAKLSSEKCEAEESVDDILESLQGIHTSLGPNHPLRRPVDSILQRVPTELRDRMERRAAPTAPSAAPSMKALVRLHRQVIKSLQILQRTETQWGILIEKIFHLEDVLANTRSIERKFKSTFIKPRGSFSRLIYVPVVEWYWECFFKSYFLKVLAVSSGLLSIAVVWSEATFFNVSPALSIFAIIVKAATEKYDYLTIELFSTIIIAYLCFCAYSTVLKIRVLNLYYLAPHHQTNEYSLIFSGMMVCRLTPPICLNFLGLIHMDSHILKERIRETYYTQIMGHMDVLKIISDGFNIYFPMLVLLLCIATYFSVGSRLLSMCGFQQFVGDVDLTTDLVEEGKEIVKREKRKRQRTEESMMRRRDFQGRVGGYRSNPNDAARAGLLNVSEPPDYYVTPAYTDRPSSGINETQPRSSNTTYQRADDLFAPNLSLEDEINERFGVSTRPNLPKITSEYDDRNFGRRRNDPLSSPTANWGNNDDLLDNSSDQRGRVDNQGRAVLPPRGIFNDV